MSTERAIEIKEKRKEEFGDDPKNKNQLPLIAEEIQERIFSTKHEMFKIGALLCQAKEIVHGKFQKWIEETFDNLNYQTALNFMRVYETCLGYLPLVKNIKPSILYIIAAPDFPRDLRGHILNNASDLEEIKCKDFADLAKRFKNKELSLDSPQIKALVKYNEEMNIYEDYSRKVDDCIKQIRNLKEYVLSVTNKFEWPLHPERKETVLRPQEWDNVNEIINSIKDAVSPLLPPIKDKSIKPTIKLIRDSQKQKV